MLSIVDGCLGAGKSLYGMEILEDAWKQGRPIGTNIQLTEECPFASDVVQIKDEEILILARDKKGKVVDYWGFWMEWARVEGAVILLDEADNHLDCTDHAVMGHDFRAYLKMLRKFGHDVYFLTQNIKNMNVRVRRIGGQFVRCWNKARMDPLYRYGVLPQSLARFERAAFSDEDLQEEVGYGYMTHKEASRRFGWFDTRQLFGDLGWIGKRKSDFYGANYGSIFGRVASEEGQEGRGYAAAAGAA